MVGGNREIIGGGEGMSVLEVGVMMTSRMWSLVWIGKYICCLNDSEQRRLEKDEWVDN